MWMQAQTADPALENRHSIGVPLPLHYWMQQKFGRFLMLSVMLLSAAIALVYLTHLNQAFQTRLQHLRDTGDQLHSQWTKLLLEQGALSSDMRVEQMARQELGMIFPTPNKTWIIKP